MKIENVGQEKDHRLSSSGLSNQLTLRKVFFAWVEEETASRGHSLDGLKQRLLCRFFLSIITLVSNHLKLVQGPWHTRILLNENSKRIFMLKIFWKKIPSSRKDQPYLDTTDFQFFQIFKNRSPMTITVQQMIICLLETRFQRKKKRNQLVWKRAFWSSAQVQFKNTPIFSGWIQTLIRETSRIANFFVKKWIQPVLPIHSKYKD